MSSGPKIKIGLLLAFALAFSPFAEPARAFEAEQEAVLLYKAMQEGKMLPLTTLAEEEKTADNAYKVQALLFEKIARDRKDTVVGYKAGVSAAAQMERFQAPGPASAPLMSEGLIEIADTRQTIVLRSFPGMMLETEFAFKTAQPIKTPVKDEEELKKLIASVHAGIEVPQVYFEDMSRVRYFDLASAGIGSRIFLIGPPHPALDFELDGMQVVLSRDGGVVNEGRGVDALEGQWKALMWLVNNVVNYNGGIEADQYLMTGALGKMIPAEPGKYEAVYPFDTLLFEVVP